jgi:hypothetical protein
MQAMVEFKKISIPRQPSALLMAIQMRAAGRSPFNAITGVTAGFAVPDLNC